MFTSLAVFVLIVASAQAQQPELELIWSPKLFEIRLLSPAGEHISPDTEAHLVLDVAQQHWVLEGPAVELEQGWMLPSQAAPPVVIHGRLSAALCTDDGSQCRPVNLDMAQTLAGRKGTLRWTPAVAEPPDPAAADHPNLSFEDATALAAADGKPLLLDFSATWCPPCQTLAGELLHNPDQADAMAAVHTVVLDADHADSWVLKDRYGVGGYPTVVLVDPTGAELSRMVGYPGLEPMLAWLDDSAERESLDQRLARFHAGTLEAAQAGALALDLARAEREDEGREVLATADKGEATMRAALMLEGSDEALRWLTANATDDFASWIWDAEPLLSDDPELYAELRPAIERAIASAEPASAAEGLELLAGLSGIEHAPVLYAAASALIRQTLTGVPEQDRGTWSHLSWILEQAGAPDASLAVLDTALEHYPEEFTYHYSRGRVLFAMNRRDDAIAAEHTALEHAYGDQRLRAAARLGGFLKDEGRLDEAITLIDTELSAFERPAEDTDVRSFRYLTVLEELRGELEHGPPGK